MELNYEKGGREARGRKEQFEVCYHPPPTARRSDIIVEGNGAGGT